MYGRVSYASLRFLCAALSIWVVVGLMVIAMTCLGAWKASLQTFDVIQEESTSTMQ